VVLLQPEVGGHRAGQMQQGGLGRRPGHRLGQEQQPCHNKRLEPLQQPVDPNAKRGQGKDRKDRSILGDQGPPL
jgi:hypothetical protein